MSTVTAWAPAPEDLEAYRATVEAPRERVIALRHEGHDAIAFAKDDPDLIVGMAVVKSGVFNGSFEVTPDDLTLWASRFEELRGVFRPPLRVDHGWSILDVVGRFEAVRVENRADETIGGTVVPMLVADVRLVGTPEEKRLTRERIKGDKYNERSSEFWPYRTNTGAEYPSVFAGCAFVDIPAVEGLGAITLRRAGATLSSDTTDPEGTSTMSGTTEQPNTPDEQTVGEQTAPVVEPVVEQTDPPADPAAGIVIGDADDDDESTLPDSDDEQPPADLAAALRGMNLSREQLAAIDAEVERRAELRRVADERVARFRAAGVMPPVIADDAEFLLRHDDQDVRDRFAAVLDNARPPVPAGQSLGSAGVTEQVHEDGTLTPAALRELDRQEFAKAWAALTTEQRQDETYLAAYRDVVGA